MRKFTLLIASLFITIGAMAQIEIGKEYRIRDVKNDNYMNASNYEAHTGGTKGGVNFVPLQESDDQIFVIEDAGNGAYYFKTKTGYYIKCQSWNVDALAEQKTALTLEAGDNGSYYIKNGSNYFKTQLVEGYYYAYGDAPKTNADVTTFVFEEVLPIYQVVYKYEYNGNVIETVEYNVVSGNNYPTATINRYGANCAGAPTGAVSEGGEFTITVTFDEMPFEYFASYNEIPEDGWTLLVMHSDERYPKYLSKGDANGIKWTDASLTNPGNDYYWSFVGNPADGFCLVNKGAGEGYSVNGNDANNAMFEGEFKWAVNSRQATSQYTMDDNGDWFCLKRTSDNQYANANAGTSKVNFWSSADNGSSIVAIKPLVVTEAEIATYYADVNVVCTTGTESLFDVYYIDGTTHAVSGNLNLIEYTGTYLPASEGVIVKGAAGVYAPTLCNASATAPAMEGNLLTGSVRVIDLNEGDYVLGNGEFGVGLYSTAEGFTSAAYRAYLPTTAMPSAEFYGFFFEGTTGVENVVVENGSQVIFDLTGRRIEAISAPGIYVVNGKKVLVK